MEPIPKIHNVVATIQIKCEQIDIVKVNNILPFTSYDKSKFAAITIRLSDPVCTCLLFTSGKLVITGASSWDEGLLTAYCIRDILQNIFPNKSFIITKYEVQNIVAHVEVHLERKHMDLDLLYEENIKECTYQKNMFPGLIFRPLNCPIVLLCFASGKIVLTGGKTVDQIFQNWKILWHRIKCYI
jgi:transcription initiation factor TFIID TATA-box-binding protein